MGRLIQYRREDLPETFYEDVLSKMKEEGMSEKEVCAEYSITPSAHARFKRESKEYKETFEIGKEFAEAWWMSQGRLNIENKQFNVGIYAFQMKNRFKWRDTPLTVGDKDRKIADKYKEKEVLEKYKLGGENENEKVKSVIN